MRGKKSRGAWACAVVGAALMSDSRVSFSQEVAGSRRATQAPVGCCFPDGSCRDLESFQCLILGGNPGEAGTSCVTLDCGVGPVGCCFADGECANLQPQVCLNVLGRPQSPGSSCATVNCLPIARACCFPDGQCANLPPVTCYNAG